MSTFAPDAPPQVPTKTWKEFQAEQAAAQPEPSLGTLLDLAVANQKPLIVHPDQEYWAVYDIPLTRIELQEKLLNSKRLSLPKRMRNIFDNAKQRPLRDGEVNEVYQHFYRRKAS